MPLTGRAAVRVEGVRRECDDGDELLRLLGLDPQTYRTDGGSINMPKVRETIDRWRSTGVQE